MNKKMIVVWDWNGTIVDDAFVFVNIMNSYLKKNKLKPISINDYKNNFCFPVIDYYKKLGFNLTENEFKKISFDFIKTYKKHMFEPALKSGIVDILSFLKERGCIQVLVSAQEQGLLKKSISYYGLNKFFFKVGGLNNNLAKSKKLLAKNILSQLQSENNKTIFVGDTLHDYDVALSLQSSCFLVSWGHNSKAVLKKTKQQTVDSASELKVLFKNLLNS